MTATPSARRPSATTKPKKAATEPAPVMDVLAPYEIPNADDACVMGVLSETEYLARADGGLDAGDNWNPLLKEAGHTLSSRDGRKCVEGYTCPSCGASQVTKTGHPSVYLAGTPRQLACLCGFSATQSQIAATLFADPVQRLELYRRKFRGALPQHQDLFGARYAGKVAVDALPEQALAKVLPLQHKLQVDVLLIRAYDRVQGNLIAKADDLPWRTVKITRGGVIAERPGWHGQPPRMHEVSAFRRVEADRKKALQAQLQREVRDFEAQRRMELGL